MFPNQPKVNTNLEGIEKAIDKLLLDIENQRSDTKEYADMVKQLEVLYKCKAADAPHRISPETLLTVGANILGIFMILGYEHGHAMTSKALGFVPKLFR
jgi:hypothetical protein